MSHFVKFDCLIFEISQLESRIIKQTDFGKQFECQFANFQLPTLHYYYMYAVIASYCLGIKPIATIVVPLHAI